MPEPILISAKKARKIQTDFCNQTPNKNGNIITDYQATSVGKRLYLSIAMSSGVIINYEVKNECKVCKTSDKKA